MVKRVCLVSSGTGGHLLPAVALGDALRQAGHRTVLVTEGRAVERSLLARAGELEPMALAVGGGLCAPWSVMRATVRARRLLREQHIDLVLSTGGRTSVPVALAARSLGVPVCLLEQNATTGRANRLLRHIARRTYFGLPSKDARRSGGCLTGTPLRRGLGQIERAAARADLHLRDDEPVVMVTGGSQGAAILNSVMPAVIGRMRQPVQVIHVTGEGHDDGVRRAYASAAPERRVLVRAMASDMAVLYAAADLVICRGGGGTVAELMASGRGAIIVPYPHHRDRQQWHNGAVLADAGAAVVVDQTDFEPDRVTALLTEFCARPDELLAMGTAARGLATEDPCARILDDLRLHAVLD